MIILAKSEYGNIVNLEEFADDGRLTESANEERYNWRKMIDKVEKLGRPLNDKEMKNYKIRGRASP